jgi:hypothetical protein
VCIYLYVTLSELKLDYEVFIKAYIRDCYYRLITEIFLNTYEYNSNKLKEDLVVVGNPGIGKSTLSFLFIRILLELGVTVCFHFHRIFILFLLQNISHYCHSCFLELELIGKTIQISERYIASDTSLLVHPSKYIGEWNPTIKFIPDNVKAVLQGIQLVKHKWIILDEYGILCMLFGNLLCVLKKLLRYHC